MLKVVVVDDENSAIESLSWELENFKDEIEVVEKFLIPEDGIKYLQSNDVDCLFLDIEMPTMDGFQFLEKFPNRDFSVVITTAYNEYGIKALKNDAIDYLMKPIDTDDLEKTVEKLRNKNKRKLKEQQDGSSIEEMMSTLTEKFSRKKISINADGKLLFLQSEDILFVESDGNYSSIHLSNGKKIVVTKQIKEVNELLPSDDFFRVHNSYVVNIHKVKELYKTDGYVVLENNHKIPVSRQRKSDFLDLI